MTALLRGFIERTRRWRVWLSILSAVALAAAALFTVVPGSGAQSSDVASIGSFSNPTMEPTIGPGYGYPRVRTDQRCIERPRPKQPGVPPSTSPTGPGLTRGFIDCKPAAGTQVVLPGGKVLYWDALAGTENVELSIASEYGVVGLNEQSRLMDPSKLPRESAWLKDPTPIDGGANGAKNGVAPVIPNKLFSTNFTNNEGSLFCAGQVLLGNGEVLAAGGTKYINDPGNDQSKFGATELEGIRNARIYNPKTDRWTQTGSMHKGRWYGTLVTLGNGKVLETSGLAKLIKPINSDASLTPNDIPNPSSSEPLGYSPGYGIQEGQNERTTEEYTPGTGKWKMNPVTARQTLPLFPRLHLLPDGNVFYDAAGQSFNPNGQAYDEALWNIASSFNPKTNRWTGLGIPLLGTPGAIPGFIGSTFSVMLPLVPNAHGRYTKASFLVAGGVPNPPSPGGYVAIKQSAIHSVDTSDPAHEKLTARLTGPLATSGPFGRWYSTGTLLPDGEVLATSGADRDEVALPGFEIPILTAELFNPKTDTWRQVARQHEPRTYHNTASLLPNATVLVGGHAIISNGYTANRTVVPGTTSPNGPCSTQPLTFTPPTAQCEARDPTFEIYKPPYMYCPGQQAKVTSVTPLGNSRLLQVAVDVPADSIKSVVIIRNSAITHLVDADQRMVVLPVASRRGNVVTVVQPDDSNVLPNGPYMVFANRLLDGCVKPSISEQVLVDAAGRVEASPTRPTTPRPGRSPSFTG